MEITKILDVFVEETDKYVDIDFELDIYPGNIFCLRKYPNAEFKKYYIVAKGGEKNSNLYLETEFLSLKENLEELRGKVYLEMAKHPEFQLKLLFQNNPFDQI